MLALGCTKGFAVCTSPFQYFAVEGIGVAEKCCPGPKRCPRVTLQRVRWGHGGDSRRSCGM